MKVEQRANIKFCFKLGKTFPSTTARIRQILLHATIFYSRSSKWPWKTSATMLDDIQKAVTSVLKSIPLTDIEKSFQTLIDRANRCIDSEGMYFE